MYRTALLPRLCIQNKRQLTYSATAYSRTDRRFDTTKHQRRGKAAPSPSEGYISNKWGKGGSGGALWLGTDPPPNSSLDGLGCSFHSEIAGLLPIGSPSRNTFKYLLYGHIFWIDQRQTIKPGTRKITLPLGSPRLSSQELNGRPCRSS